MFMSKCACVRRPEADIRCPQFPLTLDLINLGRLDDQCVPGTSLPLPLQVSRLQAAIYTGTWDLNSDCHAYMIDILVKEPPPQPLIKTINMSPQGLHGIN